MCAPQARNQEDAEEGWYLMQDIVKAMEAQKHPGWSQLSVSVCLSFLCIVCFFICHPVSIYPSVSVCLYVSLCLYVYICVYVCLFVCLSE